MTLTRFTFLQYNAESLLQQKPPSMVHQGWTSEAVIQRSINYKLQVTSYKIRNTDVRKKFQFGMFISRINYSNLVNWSSYFGSEVHWWMSPEAEWFRLSNYTFTPNQSLDLERAEAMFISIWAAMFISNVVCLFRSELLCLFRSWYVYFERGKLGEIGTWLKVGVG